MDFEKLVDFIKVYSDDVGIDHSVTFSYMDYLKNQFKDLNDKKILFSDDIKDKIDNIDNTYAF